MIGKYNEKDTFYYENGFLLTSDVYRLGNIMAHYELYKKILELPGDVVELGVFKGSSLIQFGSFRELLENENSRKIIGFDMFGEFPQAETVASDEAFVKGWNRAFKEDFLSKEDLYASLSKKNIHNVELVQGNILDTVDEYLEKNPQLRIAMLHIDTDVYEPSKHGLNQLFDRVVKGGVIILDDYATVEGETLAVEEFFRDKDYVIKKFPFSHAKLSYIMKE